jgi:hypothetical protein
VTSYEIGAAAWHWCELALQVYHSFLSYKFQNLPLHVQNMGQTLSEPVVEKHSIEGGDSRVIYGASEMQGWRISILFIYDLAFVIMTLTISI